MELCHAVLSSSRNSPALDLWTLKNGVSCIEASMPDASLTCIDLWCRAGSSGEQANEHGMAHFLEHMVFKGSSSLAPGAFDREIEALGGSSNAATGFDDVHFHVLIPSAQAPRALELLLDLVLCPALNEEAFQTEREVVLEEIAQYADQPDEQVLQQLLAQGCPGHDYGRPILGTPESLLAMTPAQMQRFHQRLYRGSNLCLAIAGPDQAIGRDTIASSRLADRPQLLAEPSPVDLRVHPGRHELTVDRLEAARLMMLWPVPPAADQDWVMGADLLTTLLSEGRRSRLVARLRETLQLAESVEMDLTCLERGSLVTLEICCQDDDLDAVEREVHRELQRLATTAPDEAERHRAMQLVGNGLRFAMESTGQVTALAASQALWNRHQTLLHPLRLMDAWSCERLREAAADRLRPEQALTLIAHPGVGDPC